MYGGNLNDLFELQDFLTALEAVWEHDVPHPPEATPETMRQIVEITKEANEAIGREMSYGAILVWGITIGVHAERARQERLFT